MLVLGLTGPTGAGKTEVGRILGDQEGIRLIDCDQVARRVVEKGQRCLLDLAVAFSSAILEADGSLNRKKLGDLVFHDREKLRRLNEIMFPYILEEIQGDLAAAAAAGSRAAVLDAPTLFESGADALCHKIIVVTASPHIRQFRIVTRDRITPEDAQARMRSQHQEEFYTARADYVIENNRDTASLRLAVIELLAKLGL